MKTGIIKAIFTNLLFVIGIILIIFGFSRGTLTIARLAIFDKYPLNSYEETRCDMGFSVAEPVDKGGAPDTKKCRESLEMERRVRMVEDVTTSMTTFVSGIFLALLFRKFIFNK